MKQHKLFWGSSYDRGLDILLFLWPDIITKFPDAELHICYGWDMFDIVTRENPERQQWKASVDSLMNQRGVFHHGRIGKKELQEIRETCGIWAYPTYFPEINCITALEAQKDGLVPVTMNSYAFKETVGSGILIDGDIKEPAVQEQYLSELLSLMDDKKRWKTLSHKGQKFAKKFTWDKIALKWVDYFKEPVNTPFVSVVTPTIRTGFWNIMADNLAKQTYQNFEWVIVDDYQEDRSHLAEKYAKQYNLNIKYIRGDKALGNYTGKYGLVRANNKAWKEAEGDLLVWLQDFVLIPERGIEDLATLHNHHPNSLLAPTDDYYHCIKPDTTNREDWFAGKTEVITGHSWRNVRTNFEGIRKTDNPMDFELNYAAIPRSLIRLLNGWWEIYDNGLGYDNTDIAHRALQLGFSIILDDTNVATCLDLVPHIQGTTDNITDRDRNNGFAYYLWMVKQINQGTMPVIRDEALDKQIPHKVVIPASVPDNEAAEWVQENVETIVEGWK